MNIVGRKGGYPLSILTRPCQKKLHMDSNSTSEANLAKPVLTSALAKHTKDTNHIFDFAQHIVMCSVLMLAKRT